MDSERSVCGDQISIKAVTEPTTSVPVERDSSHEDTSPGKTN